MWQGQKATMRCAKQHTPEFFFVDILGTVFLGVQRVAIVFAIYLVAFWFVYRRRRFAAFLSIGAALGASFAMYLYHADSALGLNF